MSEGSRHRWSCGVCLNCLAEQADEPQQFNTRRFDALVARVSGDSLWWLWLLPAVVVAAVLVVAS